MRLSQKQRKPKENKTTNGGATTIIVAAKVSEGRLFITNSSDRKFDTKLISILYAYMANLKYFINTQLKLI